ncbi:uncharacterized protein TM35_000271110, partial [Trypanosoma theileri]
MGCRAATYSYAVLRLALLVGVLLVSVAAVYFFPLRIGLDHQGGTVDLGQVSFERVDDYMMAETLRYIPRSVVDTWAQREYLVVFGIPSVDIEARRRR